MKIHAAQRLVEADKWSSDVKTKHHTPKGLFKDGSADEIARELKKEHGDDFAGAMSALNFYINRGGGEIPNKKNVEGAKEKLRRLYGRETASAYTCAVVVEPTEYSYPEKDGMRVLETWRTDKKKATTVKTSDPSVVIDVVPKGKSYRIFLIKDDEAVATLFLSRQAKGLYSPSSFVKVSVRGQGLMIMLYSWVLDSGMSLINDSVQSPNSHGLWKRLSRSYTLIAFCDGVIVTGQKALKVMSDPKYGVALLGKGQDVSQIKRVV